MIKALIIDMNPIGSFQIYALMTEEEHERSAAFTGKIYWSDAQSPNGTGPFNTVYEAMDNFKKVALTRR